MAWPFGDDPHPKWVICGHGSEFEAVLRGNIDKTSFFVEKRSVAPFLGFGPKNDRLGGSQGRGSDPGRPPAPRFARATPRKLKLFFEQFGGHDGTTEAYRWPTAKLAYRRRRLAAASLLNAAEALPALATTSPRRAAGSS